MSKIKKIWYDQGQYDFDRMFDYQTDDAALAEFNRIFDAFTDEMKREPIRISEHEYKMSYYNGMMVIYVQLIKENTDG